ncbi:MAG TPA: hypothetical protein VH589_07485 [Trebonia sp.]
MPQVTTVELTRSRERPLLVLADFDVRDRLGEITTPVLAIAGPAAVAQLITQHALISSINQSLAFSFLSDIDRDS